MRHDGGSCGYRKWMLYWYCSYEQLSYDKFCLIPNPTLPTVRNAQISRIALTSSGGGGAVALMFEKGVGFIDTITAGASISKLELIFR